jgi:hypothetical protein
MHVYSYTLAFVIGGVVPDLLPRFSPVATMRVELKRSLKLYFILIHADSRVE